MAKIIVIVEGDQGSALRTIEVDDEDLTEDEKAYLEFVNATFDLGDQDKEELHIGRTRRRIAPPCAAQRNPRRRNRIGGSQQ